MIPDRDPPRLLDSNAPRDSLLRDALSQARSDVSPEDALSRILARLPAGPPGAGGGGPSSGDGAGQSGSGAGPSAGAGGGGLSAGAGAATSMLPGVVTGALAGVVVSLGLLFTGIGAPDSTASSTPAEMQVRPPTFTSPQASSKKGASPEKGGTASTPVSPDKPHPRSGTSPPDSPPPPAPTATEYGNMGLPEQPSSSTGAAAEGASAAAPTEGEGESEAALLARAQGLVGSNPSGALALTEQHRSRFPKGTLGQEREVIAITALVGMGRVADARARAESMLAHDPSSAHRRRLARIVPGLSAGDEP